MFVIPTRTLIVCGLTAAACAYCYHAGIRHENMRSAADMARQQAEAQVRYDAKVHDMNEQSDAFQKAIDEKKLQDKILVQQVDRVVSRPAYRSACFDDSGLRIANAALARRTADPGKPASALPAATAAP